MLKGLKYTMVIILFFILILLLTILASFINHRYQLSKEDENFIPVDQMVEVDDQQMHVYTEGEGEETLVFMAGGGTSSPFLDFKSLYTLLSDTYRIVVVEKAGYGFSEVTTEDRDIDVILAETREALLKAGVKGPYILLPHSMSGIEALNWAQLYPEEVKAIIGLDMAVPSVYEDYPISIPVIRLGQFAAKIGLTRWIPNAAESDAIKYGTLTEEEKELYRTIFYRRTSTTNMVNEVKQIKENAEKVKNRHTPNVPMLLFVSNGEGTGWDQDSWIQFQKDFINQLEDGQLINLDVSHYIHNIQYERIAEKAKIFIDDL